MSSAKPINIGSSDFHLAAILALVAFLAIIWSGSAGAQYKQSLKIGVPLNYPAFSFRDDLESEVQGYSVDVLNILCRNISVKPRFLVGRPEDLLYALANGDLDLVCGIARSASPQNQFTHLEISIYAKRYTFSHTPADQPKPGLPIVKKTVVMVGGNIYASARRLPPNVDLIQARTVSNALFLVNSGAAQEYVGYSDRLATYLIGKNDLQNVRLTSVSMSRFPLNLITSKNRPELAAELRVALGEAIQNGELDKVREKWLGESYLSYLWKSYGAWVAVAFFVLLILVFAVGIWNQTLKNKVDEVTNQLRLSEERYRQLIESSPDFVFLLNPDGLIRMANQSVGARLGIPQDRLPSSSIYDLLDPEDHENCRGFLGRLFKDRNASVELKLKRRHGGSISMEVAAAMLRKGHGNEPLACCFARDLTERKRMEKELIKSDRLATIGKMAAGVAHEVNNPLGIISAHTEDLVSGELTPREASESLEIIRRNALRAGRIIEALLGQALPRSPRMTELDLGEIIDGCLTFLRPRMKKIKVETEIAPGLYWIRGDESQMQQVFVNLLLNSAESLSKGGLIKVWIQNGFPSKTENHQVWIEDNGSGIESAEREKIFDPFYTKNKAKGVGLGLFVSERIVSRHGGTIRAAESSLGGAAMVVSLPALVGGRL